MNVFSSEILRSLELAPGMVVADCGSGEGYATRALAKAVAPSGRVYAYDLNKSLVERLARTMQEEGYNHVYPVWCDLEVASATGLRDGVIDALTCINVIGYASHPEAILRELYRIVRSGGRAYIGQASYTGSLEQREKAATILREEVKSLCCSVGFDHVIETPLTDSYNYGLIAYRV